MSAHLENDLVSRSQAGFSGELLWLGFGLLGLPPQAHHFGPVHSAAAFAPIVLYDVLTRPSTSQLLSD